MGKVHQHSDILRLALRANGVFSAVSGVLMLALGNPLAAFVGALRALDFYTTGVVLVLFAIWLFRLSVQAQISRVQVIAIIAMDVLWVVGSLLMIGFPPAGLTSGGALLIGLVAAVVALFALLQTYGLLRPSWQEGTSA